MWIHFCGRHGANGGSPCCPVDAAGTGGGRGARGFTIDVHCHVLTVAVEQLVAAHPSKAAEMAAMAKGMGEASVAHNLAVMLPYAGPRLTRIEQRLADMDAMGVDVQVLSPTPAQYYYWAEPALAEEVVRLQNENIAALCAAHPTRLRGLATVALQHPERAAEQLKHAMEVLGLEGVEISTSVEGRQLDDASLEPFWAMASELKAVVFIHPFGTNVGDRLSTHYLNNTIGQPLETTIALSRLIHGGVLDRNPGVRILAAHGGGYLPTYLGRTTHAHAVRPEAQTMQRKPIEYLREMFFDTLVYEPIALRHLMDIVGDTQVMVGTDYPYDMGHYEPHALVGAIPGTTQAQRDAVLGGNAARLFKLSR